MTRGTRQNLGLMAALAVAGAAAWAVYDYTKWRSLGPGGLPANMFGWLAMTRYRLMAGDELDVRSLLLSIGLAHDLRAWSNVRRRLGGRPTISPYPIPHRQLDDLPEEAIRAGLKELFHSAIGKHADQVEYALSHFEKRHPAVTLRASTDDLVGGLAYGEVAHIHPSDHSMHMILSPTDSVASIEMGWAQRHGLAGIAVGLPITYVMIYAPRNADDLVVVGELLEAAIAYALQPAWSAK